jgi:hypothetical protein
MFKVCHISTIDKGRLGFSKYVFDCILSHLDVMNSRFDLFLKTISSSDDIGMIIFFVILARRSVHLFDIVDERQSRGWSNIFFDGLNLPFWWQFR